ncbi:MAG: hypothetical protein K8S87_04050 [Planctomycetes bacterium]|nr:hypothetical protein [Planctomycetota bacterium]
MNRFLVIYLLLYLIVFPACNHVNHTNTTNDCDLDCMNLETEEKPSNNGIQLKFLKSTVEFDLSDKLKNFDKFDKKNIYKYYDDVGKAWCDDAINYYNNFNAKEWLTSNEEIRLHVDLSKMQSINSHIFYEKNGNYIRYKCTDMQYYCTVKKLSNPKYAAFYTLMSNDTNRPKSLSIRQVLKSIGNGGYVWMSDTERPYQGGGYENYVKNEAPHFLTGEKAKNTIFENKDHFIDYLCFFRDNIFCFINGMEKHNPSKIQYNVYDFAKEIDEFIQKQPTVDEFKPATLEFSFENYNVETYEWEPAKDYLQASFLTEESEEEFKDLYEEAQKKLGVIDENGKRNREFYKKFRDRLGQIGSFLEYPMRMKVGITDQLSNKGGSCEIVGMFKGQPDAKIPKPLTLKKLDEIWDVEFKKGIDDDKISWSDEYYYLDSANLDDDKPNLHFLQLEPGRYIIIIDVTTSTNVKSRHFFEIYLSHEYSSQKVKDIFSKHEEKRKIEEEKQLAEEAEDAKADAEWEKDKSDKLSKSDDDWNDW